jgi:hypothetical protein
MNRYEIKRSRTQLPIKAVAGGLIALLGVGMLIGQSFQPESTNKAKIEKSVKHK